MSNPVFFIATNYKPDGEIATHLIDQVFRGVYRGRQDAYKKVFVDFYKLDKN